MLMTLQMMLLKMPQETLRSGVITFKMTFLVRKRYVINKLSTQLFDDEGTDGRTDKGWRDGKTDELM